MKILLLTGALALFGALLFGQTLQIPRAQAPVSSDPHIADEVSRYELSDETVMEGLSKLSLDDGLSLHIGVEEVLRARITDPVDRTIRFSLSLKHKTVRDILDALCAADPRYAWSLDEGSINVYPIARLSDTTDLLNYRIERLSADKIPNPDQALTPLSKTFPDEQIGYFHNGPENDYPEPWTFTFEHLTVRQFIDRASEQMGPRSSWILQGGRDGRAFNFVKGGFFRQR